MKLGKSVSGIIANGRLVSHHLVNAVVANRISRPDCGNGFLLDRYPRTVPQARAWARFSATEGCPEPIVVHLDVAGDAPVALLTARRQSQPPKVAGQCDDDMRRCSSATTIARP